MASRKFKLHMGPVLFLLNSIDLKGKHEGEKRTRILLSDH